MLAFEFPTVYKDHLNIAINRKIEFINVLITLIRPGKNELQVSENGI